MLSFFKQNNFLGLLFCAGIAVFIQFFFLPPPLLVSVHTPTPSFNGLLEWVIDFKAIATNNKKIIFFILLLIEGIVLNAMAESINIFPSKLGLIVCFYFLVNSLWSLSYEDFSAAFLSNFIGLLYVYAFFHLTTAKHLQSYILNLGLGLGLGAILYPPLCIFLPLAAFSILIARAFKAKDFFTLVIGFLIPYYFLISFLYLNNQTQLIFNFLPLLSLTMPLRIDNWLDWATLGVLLFYALYGFYFLQFYVNKVVVKTRKNWAILTYTFFFTALSPFIFSNSDFYFGCYSLISFNLLFTCLQILPKNRWIPRLCGLMLILLCLLHYVYRQFLY